MSTKLSGFVELPTKNGNAIYLRVASIDAVWTCLNATVIQLHGCPDSDDSFNTSLKVTEVIALMAAAQDG